MKAYLAAALAATLAQPAAAVTFPSLTTIYIGGGVTKSANLGDRDDYTVFICTNVSGRLSDIRFLVLLPDGGVAGSIAGSIAHGQTQVIATSPNFHFVSTNFVTTGFLKHGAINIETTESAVFCHASAVFSGTGGANTFSVQLHLVRVNPHPGTVE